MTSKQALKRLKQETSPTTYCTDFDKDKCIAVIENDLQVLEILKKYKVNIYNDIYSFDKYETYEYIQRKYTIKEYMNNAEWSMVREWAKNDK